MSNITFFDIAFTDELIEQLEKEIARKEKSNSTILIIDITENLLEKMVK